MTDPRPLTEEERQAIRRKHRNVGSPHGAGPICSSDHEDWPCSQIRTLDLLEQAEARAAAAENAIQLQTYPAGTFEIGDEEHE